MSLPAYVYVHRSRGLNATEKSVAYALADHMDTHGKNCFPSILLIAEEAGCSEKTVDRLLPRLEALIGLKVIRRGKFNRYELPIPQELIDELMGRERLGQREQRAQPQGTFGIAIGDTLSVIGDTVTQEPTNNQPRLKQGHVQACQQAEPAPVDERQPLPQGFNQAEAARLMVGIWNKVMDGSPLPKVQHITPKRQKLLVDRLKKQFGGVLHQWGRYCYRIERTPFLRGDNPRGWKADIDFAIREDAVVKVLEGRYGDRMSGQKPPAGPNIASPL